jgi:RHS repeat-associated protein
MGPLVCLLIVESTAVRLMRNGPGNVVANTTTYTGKSRDTETGLYYYRNRYYHAQLGRFVGRDPTRYAGSPWNLYEYVQSRPSLQTDPSGLICSIAMRCNPVYYGPLRVGRHCGLVVNDDGDIFPWMVPAAMRITCALRSITEQMERRMLMCSTTIAYAIVC